MNYNQLKEKHSEAMNSFTGIFFAFSNKQFAEGMAKHGLEDTEEGRKQIASLGAGGFILKERSKAFAEMLQSFDKDMEELKKDRAELLGAIVYELQNHEYCITYDVTDALDALDLKEGDLEPGLLSEARKLALEGSYA
jgi:hypothetical protein